MLTEKQKELLLLLHHWTSQYGTSPSYEEMAAKLGLKSKSGIHRLIAALEERGYISRLAGRARAIQIVRLPCDYKDDKGGASGVGSLEINVLGCVNENASFSTISCGEKIEIANDLLRGARRDDCFAIRADCRIMQKIGIMNGDFMIMQKCNRADDGSIVAIYVDGVNTILKYIYNHGANFALSSVDDSERVVSKNISDIKIHSKLIGLIRSY